MSKIEQELVQVVVKYREKRAAVKAKQRQELEDALELWAQDVGVVINRARAEGMSIQDIADTIGIQNRTFIYKMINSVPKPQEFVIGETEPTLENVIEFDGATYAPDYFIEWFDNAATVKFSEDESYDIVVVDGTPDLPDEWAEHTKERRAMYKDIAKAIRDHYKG